MSTKKRVFKKLAEETKVELSVQKVELGSIKIIKDAISNLKNIEKSATKVADKFENKISEAYKSWQSLNQERNAIYTWVNNEAPARISDFEKAAKELGVDSSSVPEIKEIKKTYSSWKRTCKGFR